MSIKLRELIRQVRGCKTAAEERAVISKESALIRTAFKEDDTIYRYRNIAKLLFIHMLGYPSHYGQIECLKLIASNSYHEKRIGYLGLMLLLTDQEEILTLVINSLKNDLNHNNPYIIGLSLTAIGNLASPDMSRDLSTDLIKHLKSDNIYIKKKTCLSLIRVFHQLPELIEDGIEPIIKLLTSQNSGRTAISNHAVCLALYQLIIAILTLDYQTYVKHFTPHASLIVKQLKYLLSVGYLPEYDVNGITDPFLQILCLKLLRLMGQNNEEVSSSIQDILAQIATNTESNKNIGNAILYECVLTIMEIQSEQSLKVLAINILGRFLLNRDNNIRYVALNTLLKIIHTDISTVQRHRTIIIECLKDSDASIRQRALELIYELINETNIEILVCELLNYLVIATNEQKLILCSKISDAVDRFAPSVRWHIDTKITMLSIVNNTMLISEDIITSLIALIQKNASELASYVVHKLYWAVQGDLRQISLLYVAIWCIGEYGELLMLPPPVNEKSLTQDKVSSEAILQLFESILKITPSNQHSIQSAYVITSANAEAIKNYALVALLKLSTKMTVENDLVRLRKVIEQYRSHLYLETQQRAVEFSVLLGETYHNLTAEICKKMPMISQEILNSKRMRRAISVEEAMSPSSKKGMPSPKKEVAVNLMGDVKSPTASSASITAPAPVKSATSLLDLDDIFGGGGAAPAVPSNENKAPVNLLSPIVSPTSSNVPPAAAADLLADIFSAPSTTTTRSQSNSLGASNIPASNPMNDIMGLFDATAKPPSANVPGGSMTNPPLRSNPLSPSGTNVQTFMAYEKDGLSLEFELSKPNPTDLSFSQIKVYFNNSTTSPISDVVFQAAFPKYITLQMEPPNNTVIPSQSRKQIWQNVKIQNTLQNEKKPILMKIKLLYTKDGRKIEDMANIGNFPTNY